MSKFTATLLATLILTGTASMTTAQAEPRGLDQGRWRGPCSTWWEGENLTPAKWAADPGRGKLMMQRLIVCVFGHWAPGNSVKALYVADRESSDYPWAQNPSSLCSGLFQHVLSAWPGRATTYLWRGWFGPNSWPASVFDPRANAIVAARMVAAGGWGPWGG